MERNEGRADAKALLSGRRVEATRRRDLALRPISSINQSQPPAARRRKTRRPHDQAPQRSYQPINRRFAAGVPSWVGLVFFSGFCGFCYALRQQTRLVKARTAEAPPARGKKIATIIHGRRLQKDEVTTGAHA